MKMRVAAVAIGLLLSGALARAEDKVSQLNFVVVREEGGKPVRNAAVVLHEFDKRGRVNIGGVELKTDSDGKANYPGVPYGKLRIQVLAHGFQTFGQDYEINQASQEIVIKLKRPLAQHSIYDDKPKSSEKPKQ